MICDYCKEDFLQFNGVVVYKKQSRVVGRFCSMMCAYNFQHDRMEKLRKKGVKG